MALSSPAPGVIVIPPGPNLVSSPILLNTAPSHSVTLMGYGKQVSYLVRAPEYQGDIIQFDERVAGGLSATLKDFSVENGGVPLFANTSGAAINIKQHGQGRISLFNILVQNGKTGLKLGETGGVGRVFIEDFEFVQSAAYADLAPSDEGILIGCLAGPGSDIRMSNVDIRPDNVFSPNALTSAIKIISADGVHISNSLLRGKLGLYFLANNSSITNVYCANTHIDDVVHTGILFSGQQVISSVSWVGGSINGYRGRFPREAGIDFDGTSYNLGAILFNGAIINCFRTFGVRYRTPSRNGMVDFKGCQVLGNGDGETGYGFHIGAGTAGLDVHNCRVRNVAPFTQAYGLFFAGAFERGVFARNNLEGNLVQPVFVHQPLVNVRIE